MTISNDGHPDAEILCKHAPVLRFDSRELFLPSSVEAFATEARLVVSDEEVSGYGDEKLELLDASAGTDSYLQLVSEQDRRTIVGEQAKVLARSLLNNRLGRVGIFGRILDALFQLSVFLRPTTPRLTTQAAALKLRGKEPDPPVVYARRVDLAGWVVLHYAYFYVMNDWRSSYRGLNDHEGDWEQVWIYCDPETMEPSWVAASNHDYRGANLRRSWQDPELSFEGDRVVLFAAAGSHAHYFQPGDFITRLEVPGLRWLLKLQRSLRQILRITDQAEEIGLGPAFGVPFVDVAVGDGTQVLEWDVRLLDDDTPHFGRYQGLWGLDTKDPTGSERGPGGPKYGREGQVRFAWSDPVGFVELHGTVPPSRAGSSLTLEQIEVALSEIDEEITQTSRGITLTTKAVDHKKTELESDKISTLLRYRTQLRDLRYRLKNNEVVPEDVRSHLTKAAAPIPPPKESGWLLSIWASLSVPLLLLSVAAVLVLNSFSADVTVGNLTFQVGGYSVAGAIIVAISGIYLLELLARRHFQAVLRLIGVYIGLIAIWILLRLLVLGSITTITLVVVGIAVTVAAVVLFITNIRELARAQKRADQAPD